MRATRQPLPASGLALAELEVGLHGQELEGPVAARPKGVSTSQGWDGHENKMAKLRKQRQTVRKVLLTNKQKNFIAKKNICISFFFVVNKKKLVE